MAFFTWIALLGKILTIDNLRRRRIPIDDWCCMCKQDGEFVDHLLWHCLVARKLWLFVLYLFGVQWVMPIRVVGLLVSWKEWYARHLIRDICNAILLCTTWVIRRLGTIAGRCEAEFFTYFVYAWMATWSLEVVILSLVYWISLIAVLLIDFDSHTVHCMVVFLCLANKFYLQKKMKILVLFII